MSYPKITWYFRDVIPNYDVWNGKVCSVISGQSIPIDPIINSLLFSSLYRRYNCSQIAYTNVDWFIDECRLRYSDVYGKYAGIMNTSKLIQGMTDEEKLYLGELVQNIAFKPATKVSSPNEIIDYINEQRRNYSKGGLVDRYLVYIASIPTLWLEEFCRDFDYLFLKITPSGNAWYEEEK
jgi:hypothetical protein